MVTEREQKAQIIDSSIGEIMRAVRLNTQPARDRRGKDPEKLMATGLTGLARVRFAETISDGPGTTTSDKFIKERVHPFMEKVFDLAMSPKPGVTPAETVRRIRLLTSE